MFWVLVAWNGTVTPVCPLWALQGWPHSTCGLPEVEGSGDPSLQNMFHIALISVQREGGVLRGSLRALTLVVLPLARISGECNAGG